MSTLRHCPECGQSWPSGPEFTFRGTGWVRDLPRHSQLTNFDTLLHDDQGGRNRFLVLELKRPEELWPPAQGQVRTLVSLARLPDFTVRVIRGTARRALVHRVSTAGVDPEPVAQTHLAGLRGAMARWLEGGDWPKLEKRLAEPHTSTEHVCGWARVNGVWTCIQDAHAVGFEPETACGATMALLEEPQHVVASPGA